MSPIKVLYAGDSPVGGSANYLLAILKFVKARVTHLPPAQKLKPSLLKSHFDVIVLSDYPKRQVPRASEKAVVKQVDDGAGFLMAGGWASFSGPAGKWHGSLIEGQVLPVVCSPGDDRVTFPGGAHLVLKQKHAVLDLISLTPSPAIIGINEVYPKMDGSVLITTRKIVSVRSQLVLDPTEYPLLVVSRDSKKRVAAFCTDLAPHWCGGLVDWGNRHIRLSVNPRIHIAVGDTYVHFLSSLLLWLAGQK
ncbi:MAG: glutamine amidotransferase [Candidatus Omnitrophica bacterium]|nr:glutamine amidotransferase [Candidatus Omnitrophota bacterium]